MPAVIFNTEHISLIFYTTRISLVGLRSKCFSGSSVLLLRLLTAPLHLFLGCFAGDQGTCSRLRHQPAVSRASLSRVRQAVGSRAGGRTRGCGAHGVEQKESQTVVVGRRHAVSKRGGGQEQACTGAMREASVPSASTRVGGMTRLLCSWSACQLFLRCCIAYQTVFGRKSAAVRECESARVWECLERLNRCGGRKQSRTSKYMLNVVRLLNNKQSRTYGSKSLWRVGCARREYSDDKSC
jgi:hypothetical protein